MKEACPICGLDDCTQEDPQCKEYWESKSIDLIPYIDITLESEQNIDYFEEIYKVAESTKHPSVKKISEICLGQSPDNLEVLYSEINKMDSLKTIPIWIEGYIDFCVSGLHNATTAAEVLKIHQSTIPNWFAYQNLRQINHVLRHLCKSTKVDLLEKEMYRRIESGKSDNLLMFALKKENPEYRDNHQITVNNNTINAWQIDLD